MALVAYGSSDDSDNDTDQDDDGQVSQGVLGSNLPLLKGAPTINKQAESPVHFTAKTSSILDEDDVGEDDLATSRPSLFHNIPLPKPRSQPTFAKETEDSFASGRPVSVDEELDEPDIGFHRSAKTKRSLKLPPPKETGVNEKSSLENDKTSETESEVGNAALTVLSRKKEGKSVKITVPAISTFDSDEEDEIPAKKKMKQSSGLSGLFAVLPPPKNSATKVMNRSLIPHTLSKKPASNVAATTGSNSLRKQPNIKEPLPVPSKFKPNDSEDEEDDYDDLGQDGAINFFSLSEKAKAAPPVPADSEVMAEASTAFMGPNRTQDSSPAVMEDVPWVPTPPGTVQLDVAAAPSSESQVEEAPIYEYPEQNVADSPDGYSGLDPDGLPVGLPESALRELHGKKRGRAQEDINIIDVSQDDQLPKSEEWLTKGLTEERASYSHRKKTHMPTSQQRRKHQITYLAFQAKERELELKNQWAQNRLTKRQTQSKYGF